MNRTLTRRAVAKLLAAAPAALAAQARARAAEPSRPPAAAQAEKRKKAVAKGAADLRKGLAAIHKMAIPMGAEPATVFSPLPGKK